MDDLKEVLSTEERAAAWFLRYRQGLLSRGDLTDLEAWLAESDDHASAWRETQRTWDCLTDHATMPELVTARRDALSQIRRTQLKRWTASKTPRFRLRAIAAAAVVVAGIAVGTMLFLNRNLFTTGIGEQRVVRLEDDSRITLDAMTRVRVSYEPGAVIVDLVEGQAQFNVARHPNRTFKVLAGDRLIEALGTSFTVEYMQRRIRVALLEGRVKVGPAALGESTSTPLLADTQLVPGQALRVEPDGKQTVDTRADLAAATAWREGKVIFRQEPLQNAVERLNRYSKIQLEVDHAIAAFPVSGIFGVGDAEAFAEAIASYFPIAAQRVSPRRIELVRRD